MNNIEKYLPITKAKALFLEVVRGVGSNNDVVVITKNGVPEAVMLSMKSYEGMLETISVLADPDMMNQLKESVIDSKSGNLIPLDEAF